MLEFLVNAIPVLILVVIVAVACAWAVKLTNARSKKIKQMVEQAGATYWVGQGNARYGDSILLGHQSTYVQDGILTNEGIEAGSASVQSGENSSLAFDFISVKLPRDSGMYVLIDSQRNNVLRRSLLDAGIQVSKPDIQQFVLEGDFPKSYKVYGRLNSQIETLQFLNPAAMIELIEQFTTYDFEIVGDSVYAYSICRSDSFTSVESATQRIELGRQIRAFVVNHLPLV